MKRRAVPSLKVAATNDQLRPSSSAGTTASAAGAVDNALPSSSWCCPTAVTRNTTPPLRVRRNSQPLAAPWRETSGFWNASRCNLPRSARYQTSTVKPSEDNNASSRGAPAAPAISTAAQSAVKSILARPSAFSKAAPPKSLPTAASAEPAAKVPSRDNERGDVELRSGMVLPSSPRSDRHSAEPDSRPQSSSADRPPARSEATPPMRRLAPSSASSADLQGGGGGAASAEPSSWRARPSAAETSSAMHSSETCVRLVSVSDQSTM
mmetsp:Transcript_68750/g.178602  ORF Transcript_68750/g.178602 Transcript_68750/m.178602 type:complete len:266 (-) Transcript_68750:331-1128(-)